MIRTALPILAAAALAMTACQGNKPAPDPSEEKEQTDLTSGPAALYDSTFWVIDTLRGVDVPTRAEVGITFNEQGQAEGRSGVNNFFSQTTSGPNDALTFGVIGSTKMAGSQGDMEFEKAFFEMLGDTRRFHLTPQTLEFYDASGKVIATFRRQVSMAPGT